MAAYEDTMAQHFEVTLKPTQKKIILREPKLRHMRKIEEQEAGLDQILMTLRCLLVEVDGKRVTADDLVGDGVEDYLNVGEIMKAGALLEDILGLENVEKDLEATKKSLKPIAGGI